MVQKVASVGNSYCNTYHSTVNVVWCVVCVSVRRGVPGAHGSKTTKHLVLCVPSFKLAL